MPKMMSLEELQALREKVKASIDLREKGDQAEKMVIVRVAMATCGIAAGARPVLKAITEELEKRNVKNVSVTQTGCIGMCQYEPIIEVYAPGKEKVTYVQMTAEKAVKVVANHLVNGEVVKEYIL